MTVDRLSIEGVTKVFAERPAAALAMLRAGAGKARVMAELGQIVGLDNVSLRVPAGAVYMIMGLSGSGKSTLARCINRLVEPSAGRILLDGEDVVAAPPARLRELRRTRMSMVFQHFALLPNKTVVENVELGLKLRGVAAARRRAKAEEVLTVVGLAGWSHRRPSDLSGGMRQRVGLARALATDADVLIMDEAFSALDPLIRTEMQDELLRLQRSINKTILFITHDFQEALKLGTRIAIMADGAVVREGTPQDIVLDPGSDYVAAFTRDIDRGRLFDAASVMSPADPIIIGKDGAVARPRAPGPVVLVVDETGTLLGQVDRSSVAAITSAADARRLCATDIPRVRAESKLVEVARAWTSGAIVAVTDERGRLLGSIEPRQLLARIGGERAVPPTP